MRKLDLTIESSLDPNCECYCRKKTMNLLLFVPIQDALFPNFTCLVWPFRRYLKLGTVHTAENFQNLNGKKKSKSASDDKNKVLAVAIKFENICVCKKMAGSNDKLIQCHNQQCPNCTYFHLLCMAYKCYPNNARTNWICPGCKVQENNLPLQLQQIPSTLMRNLV